MADIVLAQHTEVPETGPTGAVVPKAETLQTALVEEDSHAHHPAEVTWLGFDASGWVSVAMLILIGIMIWKKVPQIIARSLDSHGAKVKAELDEAARLRKEAEDLLAEYQAKAKAAAKDAKTIVAHARVEAERVVADAKAQAEQAVARRTKLAEEKIAAAERAAADELRGRAAQLAVDAARKVIQSGTGSETQKKLTDEAIGELDRRLH